MQHVLISQLNAFSDDLQNINITIPKINIYSDELSFVVHLLLQYMNEIVHKDVLIFKKLSRSSIFKYIDYEDTNVKENMDIIWNWLIILTQYAVKYNNENKIIYKLDNSVLIMKT